jgi:hypothetical protein
MPASSDISKCDNRPPVTFGNAALEELLTLHKQGVLRHGDIKKIAIKYSINESTLRQSYHRVMSQMTGGAVERSNVTAVGGKPCCSSSADGIDVHGWDCYSTEVPPAFTRMLPWVGKGNRGYWRIKTQEVTLNAFASGKVVVFPHSLFWKQVLAVELRKHGWDGLILDSFFSSLRLNGETVHVAFSDPQCPSQPAVFENGLWKITYHRDKTPNPQGSAEITVTAQGLESAIATLQSEVGAIPERIKTYLGSLTLNQMLTQMMVHVEKLGDRLSDLEQEQKGRQPGASPPVSSNFPMSTAASKEGSTPGANESPNCLSSSKPYESLPQTGIKREESPGSLAAVPASCSESSCSFRISALDFWSSFSAEKEGITPESQDPADIPQSTLKLPPPIRPKHCPHVCADPSFNCFKCLAVKPAQVIGYVNEGGTLEPGDQFLDPAGGDLICRNHYEKCRFYEGAKP